MWEKILGIRVDEIDRLYYAQLKQEVIQHDLMIDNIIFKDIKLTSVNDDFFFVFEDFLYQVPHLYHTWQPRSNLSPFRLRPQVEISVKETQVRLGAY